VFFCVCFRQGDSGAAMAIPGPPAASTPGIGLVKFRLFAEDSKIISPQLCEAKPACAGYTGLFLKDHQDRRSRTRCTRHLNRCRRLPGLRPNRLLFRGFRLRRRDPGVRQRPHQRQEGNQDEQKHEGNNHPVHRKPPLTSAPLLIIQRFDRSWK